MRPSDKITLDFFRGRGYGVSLPTGGNSEGYELSSSRRRIARPPKRSRLLQNLGTPRYTLSMQASTSEVNRTAVIFDG